MLPSLLLMRSLSGEGSYGRFKCIASEAVRVADLRDSSAWGLSQAHAAVYLALLSRKEYLLIGPIPAGTAGSMFPNACRPYLTGVMSQGAQLKFLLRSGMLPVGRRESQKRRRGAVSCVCCLWWA